VIAVSRLVLALTFFFAVWIDPKQPVSRPELGYGILAAYSLASTLVLVKSWNAWWFDYRTARAMHIVDLLVFIAGVYLTEAYTSTFTSPFFSFFAFLLLSATLRWGWRATAQTAAAATALYVMVGFVVQIGDADFDPYRFGRRVAYLVILSFLLIWFGMNKFRTGRRNPPELRANGRNNRPPISAVVEHAAVRMGARRALFVWWQKEEPWIGLCDWRAGTFGCVDQRFGPEELGPFCTMALNAPPCLFDLGYGRALHMLHSGESTLAAIPPPVARSFAERFKFQTGLVIPVSSFAIEGYLFLLDVPGLASDDLELAQSLRGDLSSAFDRHFSMVSSEIAAASDARSAVARDLHDSVSQTLAGAAFQVQTVLSAMERGQDATAEVLALKAALQAEQRSVRQLIANLRTGTLSARAENAWQSLAELCQDLSRQWGLEVRFQKDGSTLQSPSWFNHELRQIVREAVANAARHGAAKSVVISAASDGDHVQLSVADNGRGISPANGQVRPWSIEERVTLLGGRSNLQPRRKGSELSIVIPLPLERR
jgi:signal transduction histidine kinase